MKTYETYPVLEVNLDGIRHNMKLAADLCQAKGIQVTGVVKGTDSYEHSYHDIATEMLAAGCLSIGDSRLNTIKRMRAQGLKASVLLIRIPMPSELEDVVAYTDSSLNSELATVKQLDAIAKRQNKVHNVILMADLGDLREGYIDPEELIRDAVFIEQELKSIRLLGVGTNLGCYGSIKPDTENLTQLVNIARAIEAQIGRPLDVVSGGATSTLPMVMDGTVPAGINHLRLGEGVVNGRDLQDIWGLDMKGFRRDNYRILAQVIEVKDKPTYPIGQIFVDAFGNTPEYTDRGIRRRALVALGKRDIGDIFSVVPVQKGLTVEGGSSDHCILDVTDCETEIKLGDIIEFECCYEAMIHSTYSSSVDKVYLRDADQKPPQK